ncbi:MAG: hypothetical protein J7K23_06060 [Thermoproteales archaeon]|nr:hypothetical protein [Thermoproteales archaeon]
MWSGLYPPQAIFGKRKFEKVVLDPPNFEPGTWCGAGKIWIDMEADEYYLTSRPRVGKIKRGYAAEIYASKNGRDFHLVSWITKEELTDIIGRQVNSIENQQLLKDPLTGKYHLYLSLDVAQENIAGFSDKIYRSKWETYLLISDDPKGVWEPYGFVLVGDQEYDSGESRDSTIDIVDGLYIALYKARRAGSSRVNTALALSSDGKKWVKLGVPTVNGEKQPDYFLLNGSIVSGTFGPVFIGTKTLDVVDGAALTKEVVAYVIDLHNMDLKEIFSAPWKPTTRYEHKDYPIHTYMTLAFDVSSEEWLIYVEAVDPVYSEKPGLNTEVDRVLLFTSRT